MGKAKMVTPEQQILAKKIMVMIDEAYEKIDERDRSYYERLDWSKVTKTRDRLESDTLLTLNMFERLQAFGNIHFQVKVTNSISIMFGE